ncbi:MAG: GxxExxY protein [Planctomycetota bacterium]|nr:GxxExxY protein [Planctomycetota bacterium]
MKWDDSKYRGVTDKIIKAFFAVFDKLGPGFYEEAYHRALVIELRKEFASVESERSFAVEYDGQKVSEHRPDIIVDSLVIIEVKAVRELDDNHKAQLISQLRVTGILIGLLVNFAKSKLEFKRFDNFYEIERKGLKLA